MGSRARKHEAKKSTGARRKTSVKEKKRRLVLFPPFMSMLLRHATCLWCISMQHVHASCPCCAAFSMLHVLIVLPCCMSVLHAMSYPIIPVLAALSWQFCPGSSVLAALSSVLAALSSVLAVLSGQSCPGSPVQCCGSKIIFSGSGSYLGLNFGFRSGFESGFGSGSGLLMKNTLEIQMI